MRILIKGGLIIDPANDIEKVQDLYIAEGKILSRGRKPQDFTLDKEIDASGMVVCPGLVDMRARLREPGEEHKGTIASETRAAAKSGITTLCCPPDTDPVIDTPAVVELIHQRSQQSGKTKVIPMGALTHRLKGEQLSEMAALKKAGCVGVSNALQPVNPKILRRAMEYAASQGLTVYLHPEDSALSQGGCVHEGTVSVRLGLPGIPESAEIVAVAQALQLIELTGVNAHFCQISTTAAANMIERAQYDGAPITADVAAHQLFLTEMDVGFFNSQCHVLPPLRTQRDRDGLRDALLNGTISAICSDHQPHDFDAKLAPFPNTEPGISAMETLLPLTLRLVDDGLLGLSDAIARVTFFPANILGINAGTLDKGAAADVCIFHPHYSWMFEEKNLLSMGKNSPFLGWNLSGFVTHTLLNGNIVHEVDDGTLEDIKIQGAYEAERAEQTSVVQSGFDDDVVDEDALTDDEAVFAAEQTDDFEHLLADSYEEEQDVDSEPDLNTLKSATPEATTPKTTAPEATTEQQAIDDALPADQIETVSENLAKEMGGVVERQASNSEATGKHTESTPEIYVHKSTAAQFRVPSKQFAPLSDQVTKPKITEPKITGSKPSAAQQNLSKSTQSSNRAAAQASPGSSAKAEGDDGDLGNK